VKGEVFVPPLPPPHRCRGLQRPPC
jgi:hypothetical protein